MKILLIDHHISFCEGLIAAISSLRDDYEVDFEADASFIPESLVGRTDYDLFILDLMMPGLGGQEILKYIIRKKIPTPVMVMSSVEEQSVIQQLFTLGIIGFIPKTYSVYQIIEAIEHCREGNIHIPPSVEIDLGVARKKNVVPSDASGIQLTKRQMEILSLMDQGFSNQEIGDTLFIGKATVKTHINQIFKIFNTSNRINCLRAAKKSGLIVGT